MTVNFILSAILIALMVVAVVVIVRYMRAKAKLDLELKAAENAEKEISGRKSALDKWSAELKDESRRLKESMDELTHVGYTVTINDPDGKAPEQPGEKALKALKSGLGYKTVPAVKKHIKKISEGGKTRYSLDIYVMPYITRHDG